MAFVFPNHAANQIMSAASVAHGTGMYFVLGSPKMLLLAAFSMFVILDMIIRITTLWTWRLALARSSAQVRHLLWLRLRLFAAFILPTFALLVAYAKWFEPFEFAPFELLVKAGPEGLLYYSLRGSVDLQGIALLTAVISLVVLIFEMTIAYNFGFLPFSLGKLILWCISRFHFVNVDSCTSTASILLIGYGVIFSLGLTSAYFSSVLEGLGVSCL